MTGRYDVWLPNSRGNNFSRGHINEDITSEEYWAFTFDQMISFDTPAVIEFVQNKTGYQTVGFVGHSQGANILLGLLSTNPEYAQVIQPAIVWAPALLIGNMTSIIKYLFPLVPALEACSGEFLISTQVIDIVLQVSFVNL